MIKWTREIMNVLLINPPHVLSTKNAWYDIMSVMPPLGLAWIASVLERDGHRVKILDANALRLVPQQVPPWVREQGPFELVGITATTPLITSALTIARLLKTQCPDTPIVLGGVHPTVLPEGVLRESAVDFVVRGEGENTVRELAAGRPREEIAGISYRQQGATVHNPDRPLIADLDELPLPAYHLLPMAKYRPAAGAAKRTPATSVLATRGCPGRCSFCYRIFGPRLRVRSGRQVAAEVQFLQERYGIKEVCFYDDTFTASKREVQAFCAAIGEMRLDLTWSCFSRIDTFDEDTFRIMKHSGCHQVKNCCREILVNLNKRLPLDRVETVIRATQRLGLEVRAAFMLGSPGETEQTLEENIRFAIGLDPDLAIFNITTPFPGTEMYQWAEEHGYLRTQDWDQYNFAFPVMDLPTVSAATVLRYYRKAHRRFYLRPKLVWRQLARFRTLHSWSSGLRALRMLFRSASTH
jgi:radical SAM superfamily enzyme YgiQ (UPF0313 family)